MVRVRESEKKKVLEERIPISGLTPTEATASPHECEEYIRTYFHPAICESNSWRAYSTEAVEEATAKSCERTKGKNKAGALGSGFEK